MVPEYGISMCLSSGEAPWWMARHGEAGARMLTSWNRMHMRSNAFHKPINSAFVPHKGRMSNLTQSKPLPVLLHCGPSLQH